MRASPKSAVRVNSFFIVRSLNDSALGFVSKYWNDSGISAIGNTEITGFQNGQKRDSVVTIFGYIALRDHAGIVTLIKEAWGKIQVNPKE